MAPGPLRSRRDVVPALLSGVAAALGGSDAPNTIVLTAPSGAGKSHLLQEFRDRLTVTARPASATDVTSTRPYAVARDLFDVDGSDPTSFLAWADALLADGSLVLIVDDLQFVDAESLAVLRDVVTLDAPIVLVAARRPQPVRPALDRLIARARVAEWVVPAFDPLDLDVLVHDHTGSWPGRRLRALLEPVSGNALHLTAVLDGLVGRGAVAGEDVLELVGDDQAEVPALQTAVEGRIQGFSGTELDLIRALAAFGQPTDPAELAEALAIQPLATLGPVQNLLDAGLVVAHGENIDFAHDAYREATYEATPAPLRRLLHRAIADRRSSPVERARHVIATEPQAEELLQVVRDAVTVLGQAPGVTADLLAEASGHTQNVGVAAELALTRARALARSGQLRLADQVAVEALQWATEPAVVAELRRVAIFAASTRGRIDDALSLIDQVLAGPVGERPRRVLTDHRQFLLLLGGRRPVPVEPLADDPRELTVNGLITELLRRFLLGDTGVALEYAWAASKGSLTPDADPNEGQSADLWTPYIALGHAGPDAAREALRELIVTREARGASWQTAGHHAVGGAIDLQSGRLDDAAAQFDAALELGARMELGALSTPLSGRVLVEVMRGDSRAAGELVRHWSAPEEFGLPSLDRARIAVLEAERRYLDAARLATETWNRAGELRLHNWRTQVAPDFARVALRASDTGLARVIHDDLSAMTEPPGQPGRAAVRLALLITGAGYDTLPRLGPELAADAKLIGNQLLALAALEEAAVAAAVAGDKDTGRTLGREVIALAEDAGGRGIVARIAGRLRAAGTRIGPTTTRARPDFGWESLTPTEQRIVDLVATGSSGPEIAHQLHLSPRTVQTHVSHALAKLGLANRIELAAAAVRRGAAATS